MEYEEPDMAGKSTSYEHDENIYDYIPDYVRSPSASRATKNTGPAPVNALPTMLSAATIPPTLENTTVQSGGTNNHVSELLLSYKIDVISVGYCD